MYKLLGSKSTGTFWLVFYTVHPSGMKVPGFALVLSYSSATSMLAPLGQCHWKNTCVGLEPIIVPTYRHHVHGDTHVYRLRMGLVLRLIIREHFWF